MRTQKVGPEGSPTIITYTHDLWNRLVKVEYSSDVRAEYAYNALNWRIMKRADANLVPDDRDDLRRRVRRSLIRQRHSPNRLASAFDHAGLPL